MVKATFTFVHQSYLCIVMELMTGGDFGSLLERCGCFDEWVARFYIAEIILAVEGLHKLRIIHRDLKPDNILLDSKGHLKLTDFGLSDVGLENEKRRKSSVLSKYPLSRNSFRIGSLSQRNSASHRNSGNASAQFLK